MDSLTVADLLSFARAVNFSLLLPEVVQRLLNQTLPWASLHLLVITVVPLTKGTVSAA